MRNTAETVVDGQGRISIPRHLADLAGIGREVTFVGAGEVIEMWDPRRYREYVGDAGQEFDGWLSSFL